MTESGLSLVFAYSSSAVVITLVVVFILIGVGLWFSFWLYRKNMRLRRSLLFNQRPVKRCPNCDAVMDTEDRYCPNCGKEVPTITTVPSETPADRDVS
jgi:hypothetical protein